MCSWNLAGRIAFRLCFVYFGLFCIFNQILGSLINIPNVDIPDLASLWPMRPIVFWTAAHVFQIKQPLVFTGSGSGDKTFDWVGVFCLLAIAALATTAWSFLDRRRDNYDSLAKWFRVFLRLALASQMLTYGMSKVFPMKMRYPSLRTLLEPYGNFSPMGVLWTFIGASPA